MKTNITNKTLTKSAFWTSAAFYGLIAFEFFYMFSPFAVYFYGVYGPGLEILSASSTTNWLITFFMPHIVRETQSLFITWHEVLGMILFLIGLLAFLIGALRIYWNKVKKRGAVTNGIYSYIRHPQYMALMIASFGMVLIWPRYLVLFGFITVCFAYYFLARMEEKICKEKFPEYSSYLKKTGRFLPQKIELMFFRIPIPSNLFAKISAVFFLYIFLLLVAFTIARGIHVYSTRVLYTWYSSDTVMLSVGKLEEDEFMEFKLIAKSNPQVRSVLSSTFTTNSRFIWYVMPSDIYISEIPMYIPCGYTPTHESPSRKDQTRYKIIVTKAEFGNREPANGLDILLKAFNKTPVIEIWINRNTQMIEKVLEPSKDPYFGMPVPIF